MTQPPFPGLFTPSVQDVAKPSAKAEAISRVEAHANEDWLDAAMLALQRVARRQAELTTDDVWAVLNTGDASTHEARAIGPVMLRGQREGLIGPTDRIKLSSLGGGRWKVRIWTSLVYRGVVNG